MKYPFWSILPCLAVMASKRRDILQFHIKYLVIYSDLVIIFLFGYKILERLVTKQLLHVKRYEKCER